MPASEKPSALGGPSSASSSAPVDMVLRAAVFVVLYAAALAYESTPGPTPWHPAAGLSFTLLLAFGAGWAPVVLVGAALSAFLGHGGLTFALVVDTLGTTGAYSLAAFFLRRRVRLDLQLPNVRAVSWFVVTGLAASLAAAAAAEAVLVPPRVVVSWSDFLGITASYWLHDAVGILTVAPVLFAFRIPWAGRGEARSGADEHRLRLRAVPEWIAQGLSIALALWINIGFAPTVPLDLYYLCLLPLVWIALRQGLPGAVLGSLALNAGASIAVRLFPFDPRGIPELQILMTFLPLTGLFLGAAVSERHRTEVALRAAKEAAEAADRAKTNFLANISHELRSPMNSILGYTELVLDGVDGPINEDQRKSLERVDWHGAQLLRLIDELLDISKIEAEGLTLKSVEFNARTVLREIVTGMASRAVEKHLALTDVVEPEVPELLEGDAERLRQIVSHLVDNALKFTRQGEVRVGARAEEVRDGRVVLHVSVRDTGVGIPEDKRDWIFGAFAQADESATRPFEGAGLGLTVAARLVKRMGGRIWVESDLGKGSTFHFTAPFKIPG